MGKGVVNTERYISSGRDTVINNATLPSVSKGQACLYR